MRYEFYGWHLSNERWRIVYRIRLDLISRVTSLAAFTDWNRIPLINCSRQAVSTSSPNKCAPASRAPADDVT